MKIPIRYNLPQKGTVIKPVKFPKNVIDKKDCFGCSFMPPRDKKACRSCGNWKIAFLIGLVLSLSSCKGWEQFNAGKGSKAKQHVTETWVKYPLKYKHRVYNIR
jgi:hypothetical protein